MAITFDVSQVSRLRKRLRQAAFATEVMGLVSGCVVAALALGLAALLSREMNEDGGVVVLCALVLSVALGILVLWCAIRLFRRLRSGDSSAAKTIAVWTLLWATIGLSGALLIALKDGHLGVLEVILIAILPLPIFTLPSYFIVRGLRALHAYNNWLPRDAMKVEPLRLNPWEGGTKRENQPVFLNKRRRLLSVYRPLFLFGGILGCVWAVILNRLTRQHALLPATDLRLYDYLWLSLYDIRGFARAVFLNRRARRRALPPATEHHKQDPQPVILYLRSFVDDTITMYAPPASGRSWIERVLVQITFEEAIEYHLRRYGPVKTIGKPGDKLPPLGAAREYVSDESWQQRVAQLMAEASMIVLTVGRTEALTWELSTLVGLGLTSKLVLLLPSIRILELRARWGYLCDRMSEVSGLTLPRDIDVERTRAVVFPAGRPVHVITADVAMRDDWTYEAVLEAVVELMRDPVVQSERVVPAPA